jgi:hypothetical protein
MVAKLKKLLVVSDWPAELDVAAEQDRVQDQHQSWTPPTRQEQVPTADMDFMISQFGSDVNKMI